MVKRLHILLVAVLTSAALVLAAPGPAHAETAVQRALRERQEVVHLTQEFRRQVGRRIDAVRARVVHAATLLRTWPRIRLGIPSSRWSEVSVTLQHGFSRERKGLQGLRRWEHRHIAALRRRYAQLSAWLDSAGVFRACPVPSFSSIANNFGQIVRLPHVPVHVHMGDDVAAPTWSPIVAPFDGYAWSSTSVLGGLNVSVRGSQGYVFNAHLIAVGNLGYVHAGEVIGYVGATGDATGPHDHFEWHPWGGAAVDPYPFLAASCLPT